jgi:hypothetical protein
MQIITLGVHMQWGSTLWGIRVPRGSEDQRLVRWLNDEWVDALPAIKKHERGEGPYPDLPNAEDVPARQTILHEFLPRLIKVQSAPSDRKTLTQLAAMLRKHSIVPAIPTPKQPATLMASGKNMTEVWAMHVLLQMASDGVLESLGLCDCGCGKWKIFKRSNDRFFNDACRVRSHQSNPSVKEKRRDDARKRYQLERNGVVATGWKKARKVAKRVQA